MSGYEETFAFNFTEANSTNGTGNTGRSVFTSTREALSFVVLCVGALTIALCGLICTIQVRTQELHKVSNFVMLNSLIADLVSGVASIMLIKLAYRTFDYTTGNDALCKIAFIVSFLTSGWSTWAVFLVAFDRYDAVVNCMRRKFKLHRAIIALCCTISLAVLFAIFPATGLGKFEAGLFPLPNQKGMCSLVNNRVGGTKAVVIYGVTYYAVMDNIIYCLEVQKKETQRCGISEGFKFVIAIIVCKLICTIPFHIHNIAIASATEVLFNANFLMNSILYFFWLKMSDVCLNSLRMCAYLSNKSCCLGFDVHNMLKCAMQV
ncbi:tachykinin-like peptides receptor 86C [Oscarella lobularis]|uniref:tachykinin-like peptides receptor 86C n=1 Tax=Oscarella lobularis TaxID=121494 RepID=UPI0033132967